MSTSPANGLRPGSEEPTEAASRAARERRPTMARAGAWVIGGLAEGGGRWAARPGGVGNWAGRVAAGGSGTGPGIRATTGAASPAAMVATAIMGAARALVIGAIAESWWKLAARTGSVGNWAAMVAASGSRTGPGKKDNAPATRGCSVMIPIVPNTDNWNPRSAAMLGDNPNITAAARTSAPRGSVPRPKRRAP